MPDISRPSRRRLPGQSVHGLSVGSRPYLVKKPAWDLLSHQTTLTKLSSCRWFTLVFGHVHHFAPSPTNLRQTSHCAMYSGFAHRLSPLTCACHSLPRVVWVGTGVGKWQLQLFYTKAGRSQRQEDGKMVVKMITEPFLETITSGLKRTAWEAKASIPAWFW